MVECHDVEMVKWRHGAIYLRVKSVIFYWWYGDMVIWGCDETAKRLFHHITLHVFCTYLYTITKPGAVIFQIVMF